MFSSTRKGLFALFLFSFSLLTLTSCSTVSNWLVFSPVPIHPLTEQEQQQFNQNKNLGQLDFTLPELASKRALVNNRRNFTAYRDQGEILLQMNSATEIRLTINGQAIKLQPSAHLGTQLGQYIKLDISKFTRDGLNQLAVTSVQPLGAKVRLVIPYASLQQGTPEQVGFSSAKLAQVDKMINDEIAQGFPGAVLVVAKNGKIIKETAYGYANRYHTDGSALAKPEPMQTTTVFDLASNTKMYATNYAIMHLVSLGQLDINLPVASYLPEYQGDGRDTRLVSDLLQHNAGYDPEVHFFNPDNKHGAEFYSIQRDTTIDLLTSKVPFARPRGGKAVYSDIDYMLLGLIIERITGMVQDQYLEQFLYRPMGLNNTVFNPLQKGISLNNIAATELAGNSRGGRVSFPANQVGVIRGHVHDEKARYSLGGVAGHAGLFSTAKETAQLANLALQGGYGLSKVFDKAIIQQFTRPSIADYTVGLGWRTATAGELSWHFGAYASDYAFGHTGWTGTVTVIDPYYDLIIVLLTNKKHSPIISEANNSYYFTGDRFETGMYGSIMTKIYQAMR
ncbi:penicillin binding protein PBP4B [Rheinheimera salexigens]|uniref:N-acetylmuramoyl-L-alanine amidase n=1 Tax=Rheinheimera salexigens TaxID=1628148 RepID=A0A1E7Q6A2_9GAMM|nr:penicillin binding protein PBP4B [Rheinheimera salexigens]OEY69578.1 N-acetylmuramoyl-L-alanine amidase [Rheinheimera salexigens]